jgi:hypothetical protein
VALIVIFSGEGSGAHLSKSSPSQNFNLPVPFYFGYFWVLCSNAMTINDRFADGKRILMVLFAWKKVADPHVFHVLASDDTTCA